MNQNASGRKAPSPAPKVSIEELLESYYNQLVAWGVSLTRGDVSQAQDVVHDLWLYLTLAKSDLSNVANLDGYLYKSLRHIYLSRISRASREALQFVNIAEFDSIQFALHTGKSSDILQRQNDLRKACCYSVWRKEQTKSASYFILRFFHGYHHQEIADLACLPITAVYNKIRVARAEVRTHLEEPTKLRFTSRELPPAPVMHWSLLSSIDLFKELRQTILSARTGACLPEVELIGFYASERSNSMSCSFLSHIVSCERCLNVINHHMQRPTLKDREPLDDIDPSTDSKANRIPEPTGTLLARLQQSVRKHRAGILEHRPRTLSIAVDGRILASHDVQAQRNVLSARIERPENASFVEVFSEQDVRLAMLSIGDLPPEGPHGQAQRVELNGERWLDLSLSFDGLGLNSEVTYFDPTFSSELLAEGASYISGRELARSGASRSAGRFPLSWPGMPSILASARRFLSHTTPTPVIAWSLALATLFCVGGYVALRSQKPMPVLDAREVLARSIQEDKTRLAGQTEHQVLRFEESLVNGQVVKRGTIDLWKDGDGKRHMRRFYDEQHRLIGAEWKERNGEQGEYPKPHSMEPSEPGSELVADDLWKQDLSPDAFRALHGENAQVSLTADGYELKTTAPLDSHPQLLSSILVLDGHFHPTSEFMRVRRGTLVRQVRFVQVDYECRPASSVPDVIFNPRNQGLLATLDTHTPRPKVFADDLQAAELKIAILYELNKLNADLSEPIEVTGKANGYVRVFGMVSDTNRREEILSHLAQLPNRKFIETDLVSVGDTSRESVRGRRSSSSTAMSVYDVGDTQSPANMALRAYFKGQGLSATEQTAAAIKFSSDSLGHSQRALQHASALNRLASAFSSRELSFLSLSAKQQWTEMVARHATALESELHDLRDQMVSLSPSSTQDSIERGESRIDNPAQFKQAVTQTLVRTQQLNRLVGTQFTSNQSAAAEPISLQSVVIAVDDAVPLREATTITSFSVNLSESAKAALAGDQTERFNQQKRHP
jgi:DNA-directed RNA polymerase specialized sigma24 family protein